jgi:predicted amidohydrolase YtcJ
MNKITIFTIFLVSFLVACNQPVEHLDLNDETLTETIEEEIHGSDMDIFENPEVNNERENGLVNLALNSIIKSSSELSSSPVTNVIDGNPATNWDSGAEAPQWIEFDLGSTYDIYQIRLIVSQSNDGKTIHQIFVGETKSDMKIAHLYGEDTFDDQELIYNPSSPLNNIQYIKILTLASPSLTSWKEIEIWGKPGETEQNPPSETLLADLIYYNGNLITMEKENPVAQAIAIRDDQILAVGTEAEVFSFQGEETDLIDVKGYTIIPGLIDSHSHRIGDRWHFGDVSAEEMMGKALSQGWTSLHELFVFDQRLNELVDIANDNAMPMRVSMYLTMNFQSESDNWWEQYEPLQQFGPFLQIAGLKITQDQEWGETIFFDQEELDKLVLRAHENGWQVAIHSFSPPSNDMVLKAFESALNSGNDLDQRHRIEHLGVMTDNQVKKMAELGLIGSVQFINASGWVDDLSFGKYISPEEIQHSARWRDLINENVFLIANTDDPWCCTDWRNEFKGENFDASGVQSIYQGVTRSTFAGKDVENWQIEQAVTVQEALEMLTINSAYAAYQEGKIGSLKPGKFADLVLLTDNPLSVSVEEIPSIEVVFTMVGGDIRYCNSGNETICSQTAFP